MIKVLIVEDEPNYSDTLEMFIDGLGYEVSGVAREGKSAMMLLDSKHPDLVLMDIQLSGSTSGIDLARSFQSSGPTPIIFITAFDDRETFLQAKETCPSDYLIKPFDPEALERSIELAIQSAFAPGDEEAFKNSEYVVLASDCFFVKKRNRLVRIHNSEILWIEVEDKYSMLHTADSRFILRKSLKELEEVLDAGSFVKIHRSFIVNANEIDEIDTQLSIINIHGTELPLGRTFKDQLLRRLRTL